MESVFAARSSDEWLEALADLETCAGPGGGGRFSRVPLHPGDDVRSGRARDRADLTTVREQSLAHDDRRIGAHRSGHPVGVATQVADLRHGLLAHEAALREVDEPLPAGL